MELTHSQLDTMSEMEFQSYLSHYEQYLDDPDGYIEHYGVKGMKWGVTRDRGSSSGGGTSRRERRIAQIERVAAGKGSRGDKVKVGLTEVSAGGVRRNGSFQGAAATRAANLRAVDARIASGKAGTKDILSRIGGDRIVSTGRADKGTSPRIKRIESLDRVAAGKGTKLDRARFYGLEASATSLQNNGLDERRTAKNRADNLRRVDDRIKNGNAKTLDYVARYGGDRVLVLGKQGGRT